jgi:hypothetical protein
MQEGFQNRALDYKRMMKLEPSAPAQAEVNHITGDSPYCSK